MADDTLTHKIIGYAYKVHKALGTCANTRRRKRLMSRRRWVWG